MTIGGNHTFRDDSPELVALTKDSIIISHKCPSVKKNVTNTLDTYNLFQSHFSNIIERKVDDYENRMPTYSIEESRVHSKVKESQQQCREDACSVLPDRG